MEKTIKNKQKNILTPSNIGINKGYLIASIILCVLVLPVGIVMLVCGLKNTNKGDK
jgi:hypothetical protein